MYLQPPREDDWRLLYAFVDASNSPVLMTDPALSDNPIVHANPAFETMTGYTLAEVSGRNCRLLQGADREHPARAVIAAAIARAAPCECLLRNYRKDGAMFWNQLYLFPLKDADGRVVRFIGIQHDVTRERNLLADLERKRSHMARLSLDLVNVQEAERKALARELHDELGQRLSALNLLLHRAQPAARAGGAGALWDQAEREVAAMVALVRDLSGALRPPSLDLFGLEPAIRQLLARRLDGGPDWVFEYANLPARLAPALEANVYRIVQESVTNLVKHARARHVVVEVNGGATGAELELIVRDDGIGFDAARWREQAANAGRAGLLGMCERVELLGGSFAVDSAPGQGTRVAAVMPLRAGDAATSSPRRRGPHL